MQPRKNDLLNFIIDNGLNVMEVLNSDCSDIEQIELDPATYLEDNREFVIKAYMEEAA